MSEAENPKDAFYNLPFPINSNSVLEKIVQVMVPTCQPLAINVDYANCLETVEERIRADPAFRASLSNCVDVALDIYYHEKNVSAKTKKSTMPWKKV